MPDVLGAISLFKKHDPNVLVTFYEIFQKDPEKFMDKISQALKNEKFTFRECSLLALQFMKIGQFDVSVELYKRLIVLEEELEKQIEKEKLENCLKAVAVLADKVTFNITEEGVAVRIMDPSRVALVDFLLSKEAFESYDFTKEMKLCTNIEEILRILKRGKKDDVVTLIVSPNKPVKIEIKGNYYRVFNMAIMQAFEEEEEVPTPKVTFDAKVGLTTGGFKSAIEDANLVSDHVRITMGKDCMVLVGTGDINSVNINLQAGDKVFLDSEIKKEVKSTYSLSYLVDILKAVKYADIVKVHASTDMPVKLEFLVDVPGKLDYYLAPRIECE